MTATARTPAALSLESRQRIWAMVIERLLSLGPSIATTSRPDIGNTTDTKDATREPERRTG